MVICPANLRINWCREVEKWHAHNPGVIPLLSGKQKLLDQYSNVVSYALADRALNDTPDLVIVDEAHHIKNAAGKRTRLILGKGLDGMIRKAPTIFLSGTPYGFHDFNQFVA